MFRTLIALAWLFYQYFVKEPGQDVSH